MSEQQFKPAWKGFYSHFFAVVVCLAVASVVSVKWIPDGYQQWLWRVTAAVVIYIVCSMLYKRSSVVLTIRPDKVTLESGFIGRQSVEISTRKISTVQVKQTIIQRLLNVGDVRLASSGTDEYEISALNMPDPHGIREALRAAGGEEEQGKVEN